ncbi:sensor histidine kinase [Chryseobacterium sp. IT-36CA2]|uniref:sensor histidine kinase n=1 Tax=Chryseobacterium sp. IT-36CA2 TaxID=3026460 RepID=UPI0039E19316
MSTGYLIIEGKGLKMTSRQNKRDYNITMIGGFAAISTTDLFKKSHIKTKFYFIENDDEKEKQGFNQITDHIFMNVGKGCIIELFDENTDRLLQRYKLQRVQSFPEIEIILKDTDDFKSNSTGEVVAYKYSNIILSPNTNKIELRVANKDTLKVKYQLINLKTKEKMYCGFLPTKEVFHVDSNIEYELRCNYVAQPESTMVKYINIRPQWYQSVIFYTLAFIVLSGIIFYIATLEFRNKINKSEAKQRKLEEAAIRLQSMLNPHFTFNALSTIQGLVNTERIDEANKYLEEFSILLRRSLSKSRDVFNRLDQELEMMRIYLNIESLRFEFKWEIIVLPTDLYTTEIEIPTLLLQPLIENAIKHGVSSLRQNGKIRIICLKEKNDMIILIEDNGVWNDKVPFTGYGLAITRERIETINKMQKNQQILLSLEVTNGTQITLTFKNWINND